MVVDTILIILRFFLFLVFLLSAVTKLLVPTELFKSIKNYKIIPNILVKPFGWSLVIIEFAICGALLVGWQPVFTGIVAGALFVTFMIAAAKVIIRKQVTSCGCFGLLYKEKIGTSTIIRDGILLTMSMSIVIWGGQLPTLGTILTGSSVPFQIISLIYLILAIFLLVVVIRQTLVMEKNRKNIITRSRQESENIKRSQEQLREFIQKV